MHQPRTQWIDAARGLAVILVVLFHFLIWNHAQAAPAGSALEPLWEDVRFVTGRLRMPILMAISGYLAASSIEAGWGRTRVRVAANYYIYVVWMTIYVAFYALLERTIPGTAFPMAVSTVEDWVANLLLAETILWFILALAIFPALVLIMRRSGLTWPLLILVAVTVWAFGTYAEMPDTVGKFARTFVFFVIGCAAHGRLHRMPNLNPFGAATVTIAFVFAAVTFPRAVSHELGILLAAVVALVWVSTVVPVLVKWRPLGLLGSFVGARTIEIYVLHLPILVMMSLVSNQRPAWLTAALTSVGGDAAFVFGSVALTVAVALAIGAVLRLIPRNVLFSFPWKSAMSSATR